MKTRDALLLGMAVIVLAVTATLLLSGEGVSPSDRDRIPAAARKEINSVELEIDRIEGESLRRAQSTTLDRFQQITLLGKIIFYDQELSVKRNESCSFCHMPETGFTGPRRRCCRDQHDRGGTDSTRVTYFTGHGSRCLGR